jgi:hypothetical protein
MKARFSIHVLCCLLILLTVSAAAHAQATRTWVSGVGDDANPCSRTAPCKTFAGAISKTASGGEINVLDPGGFGAVTITKSITISSEGFEAGVLVSGTNGIVVSAANTDVVVLRGLDIEGLGTGLAGIKVLSAGAVYVEKCTINHFTAKGIDFEPTSATTAPSQLHVSDSIIRNNTGASSGGILIKPGSTVATTGTILNTQIVNNTFGLRVEDNSRVLAKNTTVTDNTNGGFVTVSTTLAATLFLDQSVTAHNAANGISCSGTNGVVRVTNTSITDNGVSGLSQAAGCKIFSFVSNNLAGNTTDGTFTTPNIPQQ